MAIVTPSIRKTYKDLIKQVINDLHKPIVATLAPNKLDCPNCHWDFINKRSSGEFDTSFVVSVVIFGATIDPISFSRSRCPVCFGEGQLTEAITKNLKALVRWNPTGADNLEILPVGREGAAVVRIKVARTDFDNIKNAISFVVDGVRCELIRPPTIRGLGTQEELVVAFLQEVEPGKEVKK